MKILMNWLATHKFQVYLVSFLLMMLPPVGLYFAAQGQSVGWIWALLALVIAGNLLAVAIR